MELELSLADYWRILRKRKWVILMVQITIFLSTVFYTYLQKPVYQAQTMVKFEPPGSKYLSAETASMDLFTAVQTQIKILQSPEMGELVAKKMKREAQGLPGAFRSERVEQSNMILISAKGPDRLAVSDLANAVVDAYLDRDLEERSQQARKLLQDIVARRQEVEDSLRDLEEKRKGFLERHHGTGMGSSLSSSLMELETKRKELLKKYTPEHPEIVKLDERIRALRSNMSQIPGEELELERLERDIKVNSEVYVSLSRQMEDAKISLASTVPYVTVISKASAPHAPISPNKGLNYLMGLVLGLFLGLVTAFVMENLDISISTIEEIEKVLGVPVLGVIPHFGAPKRWTALRSRLLRSQRNPLDIFRTQLVFHHRPKSPVIETYHTLRANIQSQLGKQDHMVLTFASTGIAEGKTLTAINFALAAAHAGLKTLLISADIRRPVIHRIFGLPKQPGFIEVILGKMNYREVLRETVDFLMGEVDLDRLLAFPGIDNFKVMTGWSSNTADVVNLFSSLEMQRLLEEFRVEFDLVVIDTPPVLLFVDPLLIAPHTDGVVLVYQAGKMARRALKRAKDQLVSSRAKIIGVVLNDIQSTDMEPRYGYYYDYGHYVRKEET